jgi:hypothetical protein
MDPKHQTESNWHGISKREVEKSPLHLYSDTVKTEHARKENIGRGNGKKK